MWARLCEQCTHQGNVWVTQPSPYIFLQICRWCLTVATVCKSALHCYWTDGMIIPDTQFFCNFTQPCSTVSKPSLFFFPPMAIFPPAYQSRPKCLGGANCFVSHAATAAPPLFSGLGRMIETQWNIFIINPIFVMLPIDGSSSSSFLPILSFDTLPYFKAWIPDW